MTLSAGSVGGGGYGNGNHAGQFVDASGAISHVLEKALRIAQRSDSPVLITGPIGSGKTTLARFMHAHSRRAAGPCEVIPCGSVSELDNALFGHRRGSFTGATHDFRGRVKAADGGTMVLDDLERLSHHHQDQLHRVLVEGVFCPVGADADVRVDVRVIATTNVDVRAAMANGVLKRDFVSRLTYFELRMPGLNERRDDVPALCREFLCRHLEESARRGIRYASAMRFDDACWPILQALPFEDHVRGLEKLIEQLVVLTDEEVITPAHIAAIWPQNGTQIPNGCERTLRAARDHFERAHIEQVWKDSGFNTARTARELGITARFLRAKLQRYGMTRSAD